MKRRQFVSQGLGTAAALSIPALGAVAVRTAGSQAAAPPPSTSGKFKLRYAPYFGLFKEHAGEDLLDQIRFCADEGFTAMFDNGLMNRPAAQQEMISTELAKRGMLLGPFVLYADFSVKSFVLRDDETRTMLLEKMKKGVETMKRTGCKQALVVPGRYDESNPWDYQTANVIENLRACMDICRPAGLVLVLEPLNPLDHPGLFLTKIPQAYAICRAVADPSCKIINDLYHQQVTEGNLLTNMEAAWNEIAAFHLGDCPRRKEPTTGEINYRNIFRWLHGKGFAGVLGMEHGKSRPGKDGERAVINAYRACDAF